MMMRASFLYWVCGIVKTGLYIVLHPQYMPRYFRHNLLYSKKNLTMRIYPLLPFRCNQPVALEIPWFSYKAIDFLESFLKPNMKVFEWGTGGSTLFFARRCCSVCSVEEDEKWLLATQDRIVKQSLTNVEAVFLNMQDGFNEIRYAQAVHQGNREFDVICVDGREFSPQSRILCFYEAEKMIKAGGIIILDDAQRYQVVRADNAAKRWMRYRGVGPARLGITTTDIYFY